MYYCSRSKNVPYSREKILERLEVVGKQIPIVWAQPFDGEPEMIGDLNLAHPVTALIIEYRVLIYWFKNPPDPRGDKMYCRIGPYIEKAVTKDIAEALGIGHKTVERAMKRIKAELNLKIRSWVTVDEFIDMCQLPVRDLHEKLSRMEQERWKRVKDRLDKKKDDGKDKKKDDDKDNKKDDDKRKENGKVKNKKNGDGKKKINDEDKDKENGEDK